MKNTFKIEFTCLYYLIGFICFLTGYFKDYIWISLLILIHECGHITGAIWYGWKIERVMIFPFGGMTVFNEQLNRPTYQEWWIVLLGPIYQIFLYFILCHFHMTNPMFTIYHFLLLGFNLLPIIPLDGSKILLLILEKMFPYYYAQYIGYWISMLGSCILLLYAFFSKNLIFVIILIFIMKETIKFKKQIPYQMKKFLLERYLYTFPLKTKQMKTPNLYQIKRGYQYVYLYHHIWETEKTLLHQYFKPFV